MSVASGTEDFAHLHSLKDANIPIVFFDRVCAEINTAKVTTNDYESGYQATEHLLAAGCRHIAHLLISNNLSIGQFRHQGYLEPSPPTATARPRPGDERHDGQRPERGPHP